MRDPLVVRGRPPSGGSAVDLLLDAARIRAIRPSGLAAGEAALGDAGCLLSEGFLDIQVNGFAGVDFNRPDLDAAALRRALDALWRHGVTRFFPTVITASLSAMEGTLRAITRACAEDPVLARAIPGIHLEGPFVAPEDGPRGAHPAAHVLDPDWDVCRRLLEASDGRVRLVTLAPERPGAIGLVWQLRQAGLVVGIGHTDAAPQEIDQAVAAGAQLSCHLGNGAHAVLPRHRNYIQKQMATDSLMASIIADGHHLPDFMVQNIVRCKGGGRLILVTDAMAAAAAPPGRYRLGEVLAEVGPDGYVRLPGTPYLAGSALTMERAVANAARFAGLSLAETLPWATANPRSLWPDLEGGLLPGAPADLVVLREGSPLTVEATVVQGEVVYRRA
jgi:N-acetylglucosamine-6-phosphate deacetylase